MVEQVMVMRRFVAVFGLVVVVVSCTTAAGPACAWTGSETHGCCSSMAEATAVKPEGCCSTKGESVPSPTPPANECDCIHAPSAPAGITVGTPTPPADPESQLRGDDTHLATLFEGATSDIDRAPTGETHPPPLFLLDCAFLT
jgi:hypothetical protein